MSSKVDFQELAERSIKNDFAYFREFWSSPDLSKEDFDRSVATVLANGRYRIVKFTIERFGADGPQLLSALKGQFQGTCDLTCSYLLKRLVADHKSDYLVPRIGAIICHDTRNVSFALKMLRDISSMLYCKIASIVISHRPREVDLDVFADLPAEEVRKLNLDAIRLLLIRSVVECNEEVFVKIAVCLGDQIHDFRITDEDEMILDHSENSHGADLAPAHAAQANMAFDEFVLARGTERMRGFVKLMKL